MLPNNNYKIINLLIFLLTLIIATISVIFGINGNDKLSLMFSMVGFIIMFFGILSILNNFASMTIFFLAFMFMYSYAGVAAVLFGNGIPLIFGNVFKPSIFIIYSNFAYCSLYFGFIMKYNGLKKNKEISENSFSRDVARNFINRAIICGYIGLVMEFINFTRVNGIETIISGKAYYASLVSELILTMPSEIFLIVSGIYFSIYLSNHVYEYFKIDKKKLFIYLVPVTLLFSLYVFLGMRGVMLSYLMIVFVGTLYKRNRNVISLKFIVIIIAVYIFFAIVYSARSSIGYFILENKDIAGLLNTIFSKGRIVEALLPAEFTVAFGNFNQFIISPNKSFKLGSTYLTSFFILIPSFLYPGVKPLQIVYEFRNLYFPLEALRGSIAGTGFSILLESYMNFGEFGIIINYYIIGFILSFFEKNRLKKNGSVILNAIYLSVFYFVGHFQRSSFADILSSICLLLIVIYVTSINLQKNKKQAEDRL